MEPTFYADILFFAALAGFIAYRLYTVLGKKDGTENNLTHRVKELWEAKEQQAAAKKAAAENTENAAPKPARKTRTAPVVVDMPPAVIADEGVRKTLTAIAAKDRDFTPARFLAGAQIAFEMILKAHAEGDKQTLKNLLDPAIYAEFEADIDHRNAENLTMVSAIIAIVKTEVVGAQLEKNTASITVRLESEQINYTKNKEGVITEGSASVSERVEDRWQFTRNLGSANPNWVLVDTDA